MTQCHPSILFCFTKEFFKNTATLILYNAYKKDSGVNQSLSYMQILSKEYSRIEQAASIPHMETAPKARLAVFYSLLPYIYSICVGMLQHFGKDTGIQNYWKAVKRETE